MRIAHVSDIHFQTVPTAFQALYGKRFLGTSNLYLRGRAREFSPVVQQALVQKIVALAPDGVVVSGDLTAQGLPAEFAEARQQLAPVLEHFPTLVMNGNHDVYTRGAYRSQRIRELFGPWLGRDSGSPVGRRDIGPVTLLSLDPNRFWWDASGLLPQIQLDTLAAMLADSGLAGRTILLAIHYPVVGPTGQLYNKWGHGLRNAADLVAVLSAAKYRPALVVHGHKHHGYRSAIQLADGTQIPSFNPGAGGMVRDSGHHRTAGINVYDLTDGKVGVERYTWEGGAFELEPGGAYASGW